MSQELSSNGYSTSSQGHCEMVAVENGTKYTEGLAGLDFLLDQIRTVVSMATGSSNRVTIGKIL